MKIRLIKDIPGYKAGEEIEAIDVKITDLAGNIKMHTTANGLIFSGYAEEITDDIDIEEIRKEKSIYLQASPIGRTASGIVHTNRLTLTQEELNWFTAYRIVKAVIEKLNGTYLDWTGESECAICLNFEGNFFFPKYLNGGNTTSQLPCCKDYEIAEKVISICEPELKVLFRVTK